MSKQLYEITLGGDQRNVNVDAFKRYHRFKDVVLMDHIITVFLVIGVLGFLIVYGYYSLQIKTLLGKNSLTCPMFHCHNGNDGQSGAKNCNGKGYHQADGKITCIS